MAYDAAKAAEYNKLIQSGLSEDQAFKQAGISDADLGNYQINLNGTLGPINLGQNKVAGVDYDVGTGTGETVNTRVTTYSSYTSTSTEQVSSGGSTTIVANRTVPTAASEAYSAQANAKQAEIDAFIKDNPSNFARKKQGLLPLTDQEIIARQTQLDALNSERAQLYNTSLDSRSSTPPTVYTEPNTTTTTETVTTGVAYSRESVNYNNDESLSQKTELQLETTTTRVNSQTSTDTDGNSAGYGSSYETDEFGTPLVSAQESVFDPRQEPAESVFNPGPTYNGPATEESVFDPRQDVGENVFDPDSAVPSAAVAEAAARINDPYYGLTPEQLKALGGADPTDPYIRARLGIPQLPDSTLNPGGFAAYRPTGVPLIDNAVSAISSFASSLTSFFSPPTKPAVTATGTTTGAPAPSGTDTAAAAAEATAVKQQSTDLTPAQQANLDNIQAANAEVTKAEENIQANNRTILAAEEGVATARETQRNAEAIIAQNNAELADENLPDDRRAQLEANNAEQYASIAENARYIDDTSAAIENAEQNNQQQQQFIQENQIAAQESQDAFAANNSNLNADVNPEDDPEIAAAEAALAAPLEENPDVTIPEDVELSDEEILARQNADGLSDEEILAREANDVELSDEEILARQNADGLSDEEILARQANDVELSDEEILARQNADGLSDEEILARQAEAVDPTTDPTGLSDEEILARQNPGGLSDEEILARQEAAEQAAAKQNAINQATLQSRYKQPGNTDWRVRLSLAQSSDYLYNVVGAGEAGPGILAPLAASNGVIFPYMPQISTVYRANYEQYDLVHSNFRGVYYKSSRVDDIQIRGTFTAQDTTEAAYLLAVIHFFKSVTKMFYGKDAQRGTPPPLVYLSGLGDYQFSKHPCLVSQFSYTLPNDVDYIRATNVNDYGGNLLSRRAPTQATPGGINFAGARRLLNSPTLTGQPLTQGATPQTPQSNSITGRVNNTGDFSTYVPTMMEIDITLVPVQTRSQVSKQFSLKDFANGNLLRKGFW